MTAEFPNVSRLPLVVGSSRLLTGARWRKQRDSTQRWVQGWRQRWGCDGEVSGVLYSSLVTPLNNVCMSKNKQCITNQRFGLPKKKKPDILIFLTVFKVKIKENCIKPCLVFCHRLLFVVFFPRRHSPPPLFVCFYTCTWFPKQSFWICHLSFAYSELVLGCWPLAASVSRICPYPINHWTTFTQLLGQKPLPATLEVLIQCKGCLKIQHGGL